MEIHDASSTSSKWIGKVFSEINKESVEETAGDQILAPFEFYTCLLEVANLIIQRPIGRIPNDPNDASYLCPNDLLLGRA